MIKMETLNKDVEMTDETKKFTTNEKEKKYKLIINDVEMTNETKEVTTNEKNKKVNI
jgi:hypothetical protein